MKEYIDHYTDIARRGHYGFGISGFSGVNRYQRGHGFFGNIFRKAITHLVPTLKFIGKHALNTGANIASDVLVNKRNLKEAAKEHLEVGVKELANEGLDKAKQFLGKGRKRKHKNNKSSKRQRLDILNYL